MTSDFGEGIVQKRRLRKENYKEDVYDSLDVEDSESNGLYVYMLDCRLELSVAVLYIGAAVCQAKGSLLIRKVKISTSR